jgi:hypothetical protein
LRALLVAGDRNRLAAPGVLRPGRCRQTPLEAGATLAQQAAILVDFIW